MWEYRATVVKVVDADTVDLLVDLGLHVQKKARIRLLGLNAHEKGTEQGKAATAWLRDLLPVGADVVVRTEKDKTEKFGRWLGTVTLPSRTDSVNTLLIDAGHAVPWDGKGVRPT